MSADHGGAFVGRAGPLRDLRLAIRRAASGAPSMVLIGGETGVGKTRLIEEATRRERVELFAGACFHLGDDPPPFAPIIQALRRYGNTGVVRQHVARSRELARLVPAWSHADPGGLALEPSASTRLVLFQALLDLLDAMGTRTPVVCVVEDLHWADRSTLDWLRFLATNIGRERLVVVMTYREDGIPARGPLPGWLAEMARLPQVATHRLARLDAAAADRLVASLAGTDLPASARREIARRADGNPLFIGEITRHGTAGGALPPTLADLLRARLDGLPPTGRELADALCVLGIPVAVAELAEMVDRPQGEVEGDLTAILASRVGERREGDRFWFAHPAYADVAYAAILPVRRAAAHGRAARALTSRGDPALAGTLARHWREAGEPARAAEAYAAAGARAQSLHAFADAAEAFERASALPVGTPQEVAEALATAAENAYLSGDPDRAIALVGKAIERTVDTAELARRHERLGMYHYIGGHGDAALSCLGRGLDLTADPDSVHAARIYARLALVAATWSRLDDADGWCRTGLSMVARHGLVREEAMLRNAHGMVLGSRGDYDGARRELTASLETACRVGAPDEIAIGFVNLSHWLGQSGDSEAVARVSAEGAEVLARLGQRQGLGAVLAANACEALLDRGDIAASAALLQTALRVEPAGILGAPIAMQAARHQTIVGDLDRARRHCALARDLVVAESAPLAWERAVTERAVDIELWAGRPQEALDLAMRQLEALDGTDEAPLSRLLRCQGLRAAADLAERNRDSESLASVRERLAAIEGDRPESAPGTLDDALSLWAAAERARAEHGDPRELWSSAVAAWDELRRPVDAAYARWRLAEAMADRGLDGAARAAIRQAHAAAGALGAGALAAEVERLARWHHVELFADDAGESAADESLASYGLTGRELEVLVGLTAGQTNREIATDLGMSVKTASVHVSNILRKLGVAGRQEAARIGHRLGVRPR